MTVHSAYASVSGQEIKCLCDGGVGFIRPGYWACGRCRKVWGVGERAAEAEKALRLVVRAGLIHAHADPPRVLLPVASIHGVGWRERLSAAVRRINR